MGAFYIILANLLWVAELIIIKKYLPTQNSFIIAGLTTIAGALFYIPTVTFIREKFIFKDFIVIFILGFVSIFLGQLFYVKGIQKTSAFLTALIGLFFPLFAGIGGWLFLKETIGIKEIIGGILMMLGFLIISFSK